MDRLLKEVMGLDDNDLLVKALDAAGIRAVPDLLILTDEQIDTLTYRHDTGDEELPSLSSRNKLRILRSWNSSPASPRQKEGRLDGYQHG